MKRSETYMFFGFLLLFSVVGVDFIFQGVEMGLMKNAPLIIAKTMGTITGISMILVSMVMGVPVLRDLPKYGIQALIFINQITKKDYLLGRFLGSFVVLLFIFCGLLIGMMLGAQLSWHKPQEMLVFNVFSYLQSFFCYCTAYFIFWFNYLFR